MLADGKGIAHCRLPTAYCPLPTAYCLLLTAYCRLPTADCTLRTGRAYLSAAGSAQSSVRKGEAGKPARLYRLHCGFIPQA